METAAAPPAASILGMDIRLDGPHTPHSTMSQETRGHFSTSTNHRAINSDSDSQCDQKRNFKEAVQCLVECDAIIGEITERLVSKDEQIVELEMKIVDMSFELASLKAFADEHRSKRRSSFVSDTDTNASSSLHSDAVDICGGDNATSPLQVTSSRRHSLPASGIQAYHQERRKWSSSLGSMKCEKSCVTDDIFGTLDESESSMSKLTTNISQFFRKTKEDLAMEQTVRRPPRKKRVEQQAAQQISPATSSIEGVVFPSSFDSVIYKGCQ
jgi:hypothetical protein